MKDDEISERAFELAQQVTKLVRDRYAGRISQTEHRERCRAVIQTAVSEGIEEDFKRAKRQLRFVQE